ncbi:MAG: hypothetical protein ACX939_04980 [Hyphococcus sp.]
MFKIEPPVPYFPMATEEQLNDAKSWINNSYEIPVEPYVNFFVALGEGIAAWSILEHSLFHVAAVSIESQNGAALFSAYNNLATFRTKLDFVNAAVIQSFGPKKIQEEWTPLYNKLLKKSKKRNAMAHCQVYYDHNEPSLKRKYFIPAEISKGATGKRLYRDDLVSIKKSFDRLSRDCFDFAQPPEPHREYPEPKRKHNIGTKERGRPVFLTPSKR